MPDTRTLHIGKAPEPHCQLCSMTGSFQNDILTIQRFGESEPVLLVCASCLFQLRTPILQRHPLDAQEAIEFTADDHLAGLKARLIRDHPDR